MMLAFFLISCQENIQETDSKGVSQNTQNNYTINQKEMAKIMNKGKIIYEQCVACHQKNGEGIIGAFPPLAKSDYLSQDLNTIVKRIINGSSEPIIVNEIEYPGNMMPNFRYLSDEELAFVATYVLNSWGNRRGLITEKTINLNR